MANYPPERDPRDPHLDAEDDDEYDDNDDEPEAPPVKKRKSTSTKSKSGVGSHLAKTKDSVFSSETKGLFQYYLWQVKQVLTSPGDFFEEMPTTGGLVEPAIFLATSAAIFGFLQAIGTLNFFLMIVLFISSMTNVFVGAIIVNFAMVAYGGKGNYESTLRVLAFSKATLLFAWISLGSIPVGGYIAVCYTAYLNIVGLRKVHGTSMAPTAAIVILLAALEFALKFGWHIIAAPKPH